MSVSCALIQKTFERHFKTRTPKGRIHLYSTGTPREALLTLHSYSLLPPMATLLLIAGLLFSSCLGNFLEPFSKNYSEIWTAEILGGPDVAQLLAATHGFRIISTTNVDENVYVLEPLNHRVRKRKMASIVDHKEVLWAEKQVPHKRDKRAIFSWLRSRYRREFNDVLWDKEWYMQDYRTGNNTPVMDLNVVPCYREGITGKGIKIVVVDDGLEKDHEDLKENYNPEISYDLNDGDPDPTPAYDSRGANSHGTRCAGEIAMVANNGKCGVGIAFRASIGGIRLLDGPTGDLKESTALSYKLDMVDIYSNSWGPSDDGMTMEGPGKLTVKALEKGVLEGRKGKGTIYIFASGNGKHKGDNCGADGYINSIYTIGIASASQEGKAVYYGERCSAIMATAYSSGGARNEMVATTDLNNTCTVRFSGTSAAAPLAAGITALLLQANPDLTWRDVQHLIVWTSEVAPLASNTEWYRNGAGFWFNINFGFGLLNGYNLIQAAKGFHSVPAKYLCAIPVYLRGKKDLIKGGEVSTTFFTLGCQDMKNEINFLEHVQVKLTVSYPRRGSLSIYVISPSGTRSTLLEERFRDENSRGVSEWTMMSTHFWGEDPRGFWTVIAKSRKLELFDIPGEEWLGSIKKLGITFHGTRSAPSHYKRGPRQYNPFFLSQVNA